MKIITTICAGLLFAATVGAQQPASSSETKLGIASKKYVTPAGLRYWGNSVKVSAAATADTAGNITTGAVLNPADGSALTNLNVTATNTLTSLTVQGSVGANGVVAAIRRSASQTNDVFQVQTESNVALFGVESNGVARTSMFRATSTNAVIMKCPNGGTFRLSVGDNGTLAVVTNTGAL
jgi:hypothetical protein